MPKAPESADAFLDRVAHPRRGEIDRLREIIRAAAPTLTEGVKWNAPSFALGAVHRVTFRLQPKDRVELIFHRGAKAKAAADLKDVDPAGLLTWAAPDRGVVAFASIQDVEAKAEALAALAQRWIAID